MPPTRYGSRVSAALGTTWTNLVNTRILCLVSRRGDVVRREMNVVFGPDLKRGKVEYELNELGVRSVGPVEWRQEVWVNHVSVEDDERTRAGELDADRDEENMDVSQEGQDRKEGPDGMAWSQ